MSALMLGFLVVALSAPDVRADETIKVCVNNTAGEVMRFDVSFKELGTELKVRFPPTRKRGKVLGNSVSRDGCRANSL